MTEAAQPYPPTPTAAAHPRRWRRLHKTIGRGSCSPPPPTGCKDACFVYTIFGKLPRLAHPIPPPPLSNNPPSSRRTFELPRSAARPLRYHAPPPPPATSTPLSVSTVTSLVFRFSLTGPWGGWTERRSFPLGGKASPHTRLGGPRSRLFFQGTVVACGRHCMVRLFKNLHFLLLPL